ncbi:phosphopantetheine-binding protein [Candidatus Pelagibacter sp.]|nr:phosphopantetheine-binding protein [Candidatus Pelagibacter sp.]
MKNLDIEINFILKYFKNKKIKKLNTDYMSKGYIDSLGFVKFITSIEKFFKIKFNQKDFMNRNFRTIKGLAQIIFDRKKK